MGDLLEGSGASVVICDVSSASADVITVDALARLQLVAGRNACRVRLRCASPELRSLIEFLGLWEILGDQEDRSGRTGGWVERGGLEKGWRREVPGPD